MHKKLSYQQMEAIMTTLVKAIAFVASLGIALLTNQAIAASYSPKAPNIPKSIAIELVDEFCSFPKPNEYNTE